jgi:hypothetical protein
MYCGLAALLSTATANNATHVTAAAKIALHSVFISPSYVYLHPYASFPEKAKLFLLQVQPSFPCRTTVHFLWVLSV